MADPIAIIGLAASIVTFIDLGTKMVSAARSLRDSPDGTIPEAEELKLIIQDIRSLSGEIQERIPTKTLSEDERRLLLMVYKCNELAAELMSILDKLKVRDDTWSRTVETVRVVLQVGWKKKEVDSLQRRLRDLEQSLRGSLNNALQQEAHSAILTELTVMRLQQSDLGITYDSPLDEKDITKLASAAETNPFSPHQLNTLKQRLAAFSEEYNTRRRSFKIIQSLNFVELRQRSDRIPETERFTNSWLFDRAKTGFTDWLESGTGIFWISGKAGSGKSTLMKFAYTHEETHAALAKWSGSRSLFFSSFYFWNQGFELQKSLRGLLRSLVFQILRKVPEIVPNICPILPDHDWGVKELKDMLRKMVNLSELSAQFCFFIDGLDEYHGDEEDLVEVLEFFSNSLDIKLCVSSRPRLVLDEAFESNREILVISDFTKDDMRLYVKRRLETSAKFQELQSRDPACGEIVGEIADIAKGVWLWVFLVTHDLIHAVNRKEETTTLRKIVDQFPKELEEYFRFIINSIKAPYREEMAQIFLITIDEVQPLPLYAFSLLGSFQADPDYAITADIVPLNIEQVRLEDKVRKSHLQNRCKDLLIVEDGEHPTYLEHPVDFLHRTVRDFLRDCYYDDLMKELASSDFNTVLSLCKMMLVLLKGLPVIDIRQPESITRLMKITDELLYYAHEVERRDPSSDCNPTLLSILDEMDRVNQHHTSGLMRNHWTHLRDSPKARGNDEYREGGKCNFLALAVQARLTKYVQAKLNADPEKLIKGGRPLLDYALRPRRVTSTPTPYRSKRDDLVIDIEMVKMLLDRGLDPNQKVRLNDGRTVWALFLFSCYESNRRGEGSASAHIAWYQVCELMIRHGASSHCWFDDDTQKPLTVYGILTNIFGVERATSLGKVFDEVRAQRASRSWFSWW